MKTRYNIKSYWNGRGPVVDEVEVEHEGPTPTAAEMTRAIIRDLVTEEYYLRAFASLEATPGD